MDRVLGVADVVGMLTRRVPVVDGSLASWARCCRATARACAALLAHRAALLRFSPSVADLSASAAVAAEAFRCHLLRLARACRYPLQALSDARYDPLGVEYDAVVARDGHVGNPRLVRVQSGTHVVIAHGRHHPVVLSVCYLLRRPHATESCVAMFGGNTLAERLLRAIPTRHCGAATVRDVHALCCAYRFLDESNCEAYAVRASSACGDIVIGRERRTAVSDENDGGGRYGWSVRILAATPCAATTLARCIRAAIVADAGATSSSVTFRTVHFDAETGLGTPTCDAFLSATLCDALRDAGRQRAQPNDADTCAGAMARRLQRSYHKLATMFGAESWRRATM